MKDFLLDELDYFNRIVLYSNTLDKWIDKKRNSDKDKDKDVSVVVVIVDGGGGCE